MIKVLHLLSNPIFADIHIARFNGTSFENRFVCLTTEFEYSGPYLSLLEWVVPFSSSYDAIKENSGSFDLVFVYNLDHIKSRFINEIPGDTLIVWHLYGTELYNNYEPFKYSIYSDLTKKKLNINKRTILAGRIKRTLSRIKHIFLNKRPSYDELQLAISRVNFLAWYSKAEYDYLQAGLTFKLPPFLQLSVLVKEPAVIQPGNQPGNSIWLGNSASPENNHLDILHLLQKVAFKNSILLPFSYGNQRRYSHFIKDFKKTTGLQIELLENFADYNQFAYCISNCRAAVFNSYRQLALGNIFLAIRYGLKIYLNELNPSFGWLKINGFHLFSIQRHLETDLQNNHLSLLPALVKQNQEAYDKLISTSNNDLFLKQLTAVVIDWKKRQRRQL